MVAKPPHNAVQFSLTILQSFSMPCLCDLQRNDLNAHNLQAKFPCVWMNKTTEKSVFYPWHCHRKLFWAFHEFQCSFYWIWNKLHANVLFLPIKQLRNNTEGYRCKNSLGSENSEPMATSGRKLCSLLFLVLAVSVWTSRYVSLGTFRYILILAQKF